MQMREGIGFPSSCKVLVPYCRPMSWRDPNGFYRTLGITPMSSDEEVRKAGRALLARYHPDGPEPDEEKFLDVQDAYRTLTEDRVAYDSTPDDHVLVTEANKTRSDITTLKSSYAGWGYFSEVPRATDDSVAVWAYEHYLAQALAIPTTMPRLAVVLIQGKGNPWVDDGLIYVPVSEIEGRVVATSEKHSEAQGQG